jgi:hypothetical protein
MLPERAHLGESAFGTIGTGFQIYEVEGKTKTTLTADL